MHRGDIVLLAFPFSDGRGIKVRPAVVVQTDRNNQRLTNTIVAMITSATARAHKEPTQLRIDLHSPAGRASGLLHDSAVKCENLFTIEQRAIVKVIGKLPEGEMKKVDHCLRATLGFHRVMQYRPSRPDPLLSLDRREAFSARRRLYLGACPGVQECYVGHANVREIGSTSLAIAGILKQLSPGEHHDHPSRPTASNV